MNERKTIVELLDIRFDFESNHNYRITFDAIKKTQGILPDDEILSIAVRSGFEPPMFGNDPDETIHYCYPVFVVKRARPETDDEYLARMKKEELARKIQEEKDKLEYLRLKAIFEPNS